MNPVKQFNKLTTVQKAVGVVVILAIILAIYLYLTPRPENADLRKLRRKIKRQARKLGMY